MFDLPTYRSPSVRPRAGTKPSWDASSIAAGGAVFGLAASSRSLSGLASCCGEFWLAYPPSRCVASTAVNATALPIVLALRATIPIAAAAPMINRSMPFTMIDSIYECGWRGAGCKESTHVVPLSHPFPLGREASTIVPVAM